MGASSKRKGRVAELELAATLRDMGFENVQAGLCSSYGVEPDLYGLENIHIECKRVEHLNIAEAMAQAERDAMRFKDGAPAVFHRRNRGPWLVTMHLEDWAQLYRD